MHQVKTLSTACYLNFQISEGNRSHIDVVNLIPWPAGLIATTLKIYIYVIVDSKKSKYEQGKNTMEIHPLSPTLLYTGCSNAFNQADMTIPLWCSLNFNIRLQHPHRAAPRRP